MVFNFNILSFNSFWREYAFSYPGAVLLIIVGVIFFKIAKKDRHLRDDPFRPDIRALIIAIFTLALGLIMLISLIFGIG